jgi:hypothetical protein
MRAATVARTILSAIAGSQKGPRAAASSPVHRSVGTSFTAGGIKGLVRCHASSTFPAGSPAARLHPAQCPEKNLRHFNVFAGRQESPAKPRVRAAIFAGSF